MADTQRGYGKESVLHLLLNSLWPHFKKGTCNMWDESDGSGEST